MRDVEHNGSLGETPSEPRVWALDPLAEASGETLSVTQVELVRVAMVAAETGARMQRDGIAVDPMDWMISPRKLFDGRPAIEAAMKRDGCTVALLLHGLGLDLDADPTFINEVLASRRRAPGHD